MVYRLLIPSILVLDQHVNRNDGFDDEHLERINTFLCLAILTIAFQQLAEAWDLLPVT